MATLRQSLIALRAAPIVTIVTIVSLMLDIGANTAIFSIVDGLLLRQLPVREPQRLVIITGGNAVSPESWNYAAWDEIRRRPDLFENAAAWAFSQFNLAGRGETRYIDGIAVSGSFFETLGMPILAGRGLSASDDQPGGGTAGPVAVISYRFWQSEFAGQTDAIGRQLVLSGTPFTIVGITPAYFYGPEPGRRFDAMVPVANEPLATGVNRLVNREWQWLTIIARLKRDQTEEAAASALRGIQQQVLDASIPNLAPPFKEQYLRGGFGLIPAATGTSTLRQRFQRPLVAVLVLVLLVQLIGSVNVANVLLARSSARQTEFGIRIALGASPRQMFTQLLVESLLLSICGAASGMLLARWMSELLIRQLWTQSGPVFLQLGIDWRVLAFTATVAVATALLCGVAPALRASRVDPIDTLNARGQTGSLQRSRATAVAVVAQVALSPVILIAAALFLRTFQALPVAP